MTSLSETISVVKGDDNSCPQPHNCSLGDADMSGYRAISASLAEWTGSIGRFTETLDEQGQPYLSYSKLSTLEFCQYRYFLEYVEKVRLRPQPSYFVKGHLFHDAAARVYRSIAAQKQVDVTKLHARIDKRAVASRRRLQTQ